MYCISLYFDSNTNEYIQSMIKKCELIKIEDTIPFHITLAASYQNIEWEPDCSSFEIQFVSIACLKNNLCLIPIMNDSLYTICRKAQSSILEKDCHPYYKKGNLFPHLTLIRHLNSNELKEAFDILNKQFVPFQSKVIKISISQTKPYQDLKIYHLD